MVVHKSQKNLDLSSNLTFLSRLPHLVSAVVVVVIVAGVVRVNIRHSATTGAGTTKSGSYDLWNV